MASKLILTPEELTAFLKKEKFGFVLMGLCLAIPFLIWGCWVIAEMYRPVVLPQPVMVIIEKDAGFLDVIEIISRNNIARPASLKLYLLATGNARKIKVGTYVFDGAVSAVDVSRQLVRGPSDLQVTIPEGYTILDVDKRLAQSGLIKSGDIIEAASRPNRFAYDFLRSDEITSLEGFLFPDTYRFSPDMGSDDIINKMLVNFERKALPMFPERVANDPGTLYLILKVASLVEKEVPKPLDQAIVAGIIWKRLDIGMALQIDASVVYALRLQDPNWQPDNHSLSANDLKIKSLYNTYKYKDLPPTPIGNPGLAAIKAVLDPQESPYLYYLSTPDGTTIFSKTLEEHNQAKAKYLK